MQLIDGKIVSAKVKDEVKEGVGALAAKGIHGTLAVIQVGDDPASSIYVRNKARACEYVGLGSVVYHEDASMTEEALLEKIDGLNRDPEIIGILVQLPLPDHMNEIRITEAIDPAKDVDGFHPTNVGALSIGRDCMLPCTPAGVIRLLHEYGIDADGKHCVVIGRSNIVGKPMGMLMLRENATVTMAHSHTKDLPALCRTADILIAAVGITGFVTKEFVKEGAVVIDVGINRDENNKLHGDVAFDEVKDIASAITPVPGGVGMMTIAMLMQNCLTALKNRQQDS